MINASAFQLLLISMPVPLSKKLRVGALVASATLIGPLFGRRFPALVFALGVPPGNSPLSVQRVSAIVTYPLAHPGLWAWLSNSVYICLGCWLVSARITERQQWALLLAGVGTGALVFEVLGARSVLVGTGPAAFSIVGSVVVYGSSRWRSLAYRWRTFVILSMALILGLFLDSDPSARCNFAAAVVGSAVTVWWLVIGRWVTSEVAS